MDWHEKELGGLVLDVEAKRDFLCMIKYLLLAYRTFSAVNIWIFKLDNS